jgi:hypothetical protein
MPNLISSAFFVGELSIPNLQQESVSENLAYFITKYEKECLIGTLGYHLYKLTLVPRDSMEQRIKDLLDGVEYKLNGKLTKWEGLVHGDYSLIANYIYWFFMKNNATHTTGVATTKSNAAASISVSPAEKMVAAWNDMSDRINQMILFLRNKKNESGVLVYPEFDNNQIILTKNSFRKITLLL